MFFGFASFVATLGTEKQRETRRSRRKTSWETSWTTRWETSWETSSETSWETSWKTSWETREPRPREGGHTIQQREARRETRGDKASGRRTHHPTTGNKKADNGRQGETRPREGRRTHHPTKGSKKEDKLGGKSGDKLGNKMGDRDKGEKAS